MATAPNSDARVRRARTAEKPIATRAPRSVTADAPREQDDLDNLTPTQRARMLADEFTQQALPKVPPIKGYHTCWLSTTSSYDPIHKRMRVGYQPVTTSDFPGGNFPEGVPLTSGQYEGAFSCNEMVLFKIRQDIYQAVMEEFHHEAPLREEQGIKAALKGGGRTDSQGTPLMDDEDVIGEGFEDLAKPRPVPVFN